MQIKVANGNEEVETQHHAHVQVVPERCAFHQLKISKILCLRSVLPGSAASAVFQNHIPVSMVDSSKVIEVKIPYLKPFLVSADKPSLVFALVPRDASFRR